MVEQAKMRTDRAGRAMFGATEDPPSEEHHDQENPTAEIMPIRFMMYYFPKVNLYSTLESLGRGGKGRTNDYLLIAAFLVQALSAPLDCI
jgi:hypothetical protein